MAASSSASACEQRPRAPGRFGQLSVRASLSVEHGRLSHLRPAPHCAVAAPKPVVRLRRLRPCALAVAWHFACQYAGRQHVADDSTSMIRAEREQPIVLDPRSASSCREQEAARARACVRACVRAHRACPRRAPPPWQTPPPPPGSGAPSSAPRPAPAPRRRPRPCAPARPQRVVRVIESRWVAELLARAGRLRPPRLNDPPGAAHLLLQLPRAGVRGVRGQRPAAEGVGLGPALGLELLLRLLVQLLGLHLATTRAGGGLRDRQRPRASHQPANQPGRHGHHRPRSERARERAARALSVTSARSSGRRATASAMPAAAAAERSASAAGSLRCARSASARWYLAPTLDGQSSSALRHEYISG
jgi:hypothetical protein